MVLINTTQPPSERVQSAFSLFSGPDWYRRIALYIIAGRSLSFCCRQVSTLIAYSRMAYLQRGQCISLYITCEADNVYDEQLRAMMREAMEHFKGFHDVFRLDRNCTCSRAVMNTCLYEWSMLALRIQYVYLFILHFPADAPTKSPQIKFVHKEFVAKVKLLYRQINACARVKYYATINRLIHLTEILACGMYVNQIPWYGCVRCDTPFDKPQLWKKNPVVKCLAEVHMAAYNVVAQHLGIPSECKCPPGNYHFQEEVEEPVEDEQAAAEE